jgi:hypothetical protein
MQIENFSTKKASPCHFVTLEFSAQDSHFIKTDSKHPLFIIFYHFRLWG